MAGSTTTKSEEFHPTKCCNLALLLQNSKNPTGFNATQAGTLAEFQGVNLNKKNVSQIPFSQEKLTNPSTLQDLFRKNIHLFSHGFDDFFSSVWTTNHVNFCHRNSALSQKHQHWVIGKCIATDEFAMNFPCDEFPPQTSLKNVETTIIISSPQQGVPPKRADISRRNAEKLMLKCSSHLRVKNSTWIQSTEHL